MNVVLLFPGQSSRYPGMLQKLADECPAVVLPLFQHASDVLHRSVTDYDTADAIASNEYVQVSVFLANHAYWQILRHEGIEGDFSAGLSLGEYNHLVHIGALEFDAALSLVVARAAAYDRGPLGIMAAVFPVEEDAVADAVSKARAHGICEIVNFNSPTQHVLAGDRAAVDEAIRILEDEQAATCVVIDQRLPMHCSLFAPVAALFSPALASAPFNTPGRPYLPNVLGRFADDVQPRRIRALLADHVHQPVLFRQSIDVLFDRSADGVFIEVGPKNVIHNLLGRKWHPFRRYRTDVGPNLAAAVSEMAKELRRAA